MSVDPALPSAVLLAASVTPGDGASTPGALTAPVGTRHPTRFELWAWAPVIVLRIALVATYLLGVALAVMAFIAGVPVFDLTAPHGYAAPWAVMLGISAILAAIGGLHDGWAKLELWAALGFFALALGYVVPIYVIAFTTGDLNRQTVAVAVTFMLILPASRFGWLAAQSGRKKETRPPSNRES